MEGRKLVEFLQSLEEDNATSLTKIESLKTSLENHVKQLEAVQRVAYNGLEISRTFPELKTRLISKLNATINDICDALKAELFNFVSLMAPLIESDQFEDVDVCKAVGLIQGHSKKIKCLLYSPDFLNDALRIEVAFTEEEKRQLTKFLLKFH